MGVSRQQKTTWPMRGKMRSPGRPPGWQRDQRQRFWIEISKGISSEDAAFAVGMASAVGSRWFREAGGMRPISLAPLSGRYLSLPEREEIAILNAKGFGVREIARQLQRSASTISRELRRNAATRSNSSGYRSVTAQWHADRRARRPKVAKLAGNERLRTYVQDRLAGLITRPDGTEVPGPTVHFIGRRHGRRQDRRWAKSWSPEQISNRLRVDFPDDENHADLTRGDLPGPLYPGSRRIEARARRVPPDGQSAARAAGSHAWAGKEVRPSGDHDQ